jgi:hypothetical protein
MNIHAQELLLIKLCQQSKHIFNRTLLFRQLISHGEKDTLAVTNN